jgi:hypothetical protein
MVIQQWVLGYTQGTNTKTEAFRVSTKADSCRVRSREKNFFKEKPLYRRFVIHEPRINTSGVEDMPAS